MTASGDEPVSVYVLADGTRTGSACGWEFGIVGPDPTTDGPNTALFFGTAYWGRGEGNGPWFGADFEAGVWMGGSYPGEPGWGALNDAHPANGDNRSLDLPLALGFLKGASAPEQYALRVAHVGTAVETAYAGEFRPSPPWGIGVVLPGRRGRAGGPREHSGRRLRGVKAPAAPLASVSISRRASASHPALQAKISCRTFAPTGS